MENGSSTDKPSKRGPKPKGARVMTAAERQARRREKKREHGGKPFMFWVEGAHLEYVEALAARQDIPMSVALKNILEPALDRFVGVMRRCEELAAAGATDQAVTKFVEDHLFPALPPMSGKGGAKK